MADIEAPVLDCSEVETQAPGKRWDAPPLGRTVPKQGPSPQQGWWMAPKAFEAYGKSSPLPAPPHLLSPPGYVPPPVKMATGGSTQGSLTLTPRRGDYRQGCIGDLYIISYPHPPLLCYMLANFRVGGNLGHETPEDPLLPPSPPPKKTHWHPTRRTRTCVRQKHAKRCQPARGTGGGRKLPSRAGVTQRRNLSCSLHRSLHVPTPCSTLP